MIYTQLYVMRLLSSLEANVYMPYEIAGMNSTSTEEFIALLSSIEYLISQNQDCIAIVGGDFNVELCRNSTLHSAE